MAKSLLLCFLVFAALVGGTYGAVQLEFWQPAAAYSYSFWRGVADAFTAAHPDIEVVINANHTWATIEADMLEAWREDRQPDVSWVGNTFMASWQFRGLIKPLTSRFREWSREIKTDVTLRWWRPVSYDYQIDGQWWTLPIVVGSHSLYMNTALVRAVTNDTTPPTTWQQLYDLAYLINTTLPGVWGFGAMYGQPNDLPNFVMPLLQSYGGSAFDAEQRCNLDAPESKAAMDFYSSFYRSGIAPAANATYALNEALFRAGRLAFYINGPWVWWDFHAALSSGSGGELVAMNNTPGGPFGHFGFLAGEGFVLPSRSRHPDEAWTFMRWVAENIPGASDAGISAVQERTTLTNCPAQPRPEFQPNPSTWWTMPTAQQVQAMSYAYPIQFPDVNGPYVAALLQPGVLDDYLQSLNRGDDLDATAERVCQTFNKLVDELTRQRYPTWDGSAFEAAFTAVLAVCLAVALLGAAGNVYYRDYPLFWVASPLFCAIIWLGAVMGLVALFFFAYPATGGRCLARYWLGFTSFSLIFGSLFAKTWRIWRIVSQSMLFRASRISNQLTLFIVGCGLAPVLLLLVLWSAVDTLTVEWVPVSNEQYKQLQCTSAHYWVWMGLLLGLLAAQSCAGLLIAFVSRKLAGAVSESRPIFFSLITCAVVAAVIIPLVYGLEDSPEAVVVLAVTGGVVAIMLTLLLLFGFKFWAAVRNKPMTKDQAFGLQSRSSADGSIRSTVGSSS